RGFCFFFFFQAEDGIRDLIVTGVQTCALPISLPELEALGVRRVSIGPWAMRAASSLTRRIGEQLLGEGTYAFADWQPYPDLNARSEERRVGKECRSRGSLRRSITTEGEMVVGV